MAAVVLWIVAAVVVAAVLGVALWWMRRSPHRGTGEASAPPIVFLPAPRPHERPLVPAPPVSAARPLPAPNPDLAATPPASQPAIPVAEAFTVSRTMPRARAVGGDREVGPPGDAAVAPPRRRWDRPRVVRDLDDAADVPTVASVLTGTLRMLPGRLEVVAGLPQRSEIRFVQTAGPEQRVTLGRQEGPPYEHIRLDSQTVSRMHAVLTFSDGRWRIGNLSETNPLRVNGLTLTRDGPPVQLADGDTVELGEVVFRYRS